MKLGRDHEKGSKRQIGDSEGSKLRSRLWVADIPQPTCQDEFPWQKKDQIAKHSTAIIGRDGQGSC